MPLCKHQVRPMGWSLCRAETCLAPFRALPCTTTVTTRIEGGGVYSTSPSAFYRFSLAVSNPRVVISFVHTIVRHCRTGVSGTVLKTSAVSEICLGNIHFHCHSIFFSLRTHVDTHSLLYVILAIHCIHRYYFDLRIYTISDTTLHALTVDTI